MASAESSGLMSEKKNFASSSKSENLVPPEFDDCACPRARLLATEIYRPHVPGYFALKNHLITRSIFEFEMGHITSSQLNALYAQLKRSNDQNIFACHVEAQLGNEDNFTQIKEDLECQFRELSNQFYSRYLFLLESASRGTLIVQPMCSGVFERGIISD